MSAGSGSRPGPESGPVSRPTAGGRTTAPRRRSVATLSCVAGCSHISVCMAGTNTTGQVAVSSVAVSRSSARPGGRAGQQVGGGGGDDDELGLAADPDVRDLGHVVPDVGGDRVAGQRLEGRGADELQRGRASG